MSSVSSELCSAERCGDRIVTAPKIGGQRSELDTERVRLFRRSVTTVCNRNVKDEIGEKDVSCGVRIYTPHLH